MPSDGRHPFFDDGRALHWYTRLDEARAQAEAGGRHLFVCWGGPRCLGTRALVERTIPKAEVAEYLDRHFVAVAVDPAAPDPAVAALVPALPKREPTPLCLYLHPDGRLAHATAGGRPAAVFLTDMMEALARK
jgi:hypothetical protein